MYVIKIGSVKVSPTAFVSFPAVRGSGEVPFHILIFGYSYLELLTF